jgi:hypothetical protein
VRRASPKLRGFVGFNVARAVANKASDLHVWTTGSAQAISIKLFDAAAPTLSELIGS